MKTIECLFHKAEPDTPKGDEFEKLAEWAEEYKAKYFPFYFATHFVQL